MVKEVQLKIDGLIFDLSLEEGLVHLFNSNALQDYIQQNKWEGAILISKKIQDVYVNTFSRALDVSEDSVAVEILGHIYFEDFFEALGKLIPLTIMERLNEKIQSHCEEVNIGETGKDSNRFFWDLVSPIVKGFLKIRVA